MKIDWTPTADGLPDKAGAYLVTAVPNEFHTLRSEGPVFYIPFVDVMYFYADIGKWGFKEYDVLAWAERPEPWEREGEE